ncbi:MAG TPA: ATP-binding protein [Actinomycetota bacterium]|nr:ATP-binding protein [Actinomycetota bacterium]
MNREEFHLNLPSRADHLGTARTFAAAIARHYEVAGETVEDVKLAISEACVDALVAGAPIEVSARRTGDAVWFEIEAPDAGDSPERAALDALGSPARIELIASLFPGAEIVKADTRRAVRFSLPLG